MPETCPYCGAVVDDAWAEVAHMEAEHPEVIERRLTAAGFLREDDGTIIDLRAGEE